MNYERWVWTELIAFDNSREDFGAAEYLAILGFVPAGMCLLVSTPNFVLTHSGMEQEIAMPADVCSRNAHPGNEARNRQQWTNFQIRALVNTLTKQGCPVYLSFFTGWSEDKYSHEWLTDHPEARQVFSYYGRGKNINVLGLLNDGSLVEDYFIPQTVKTCCDYGFSGWHGPDGFGPHSSGNIMGTDFSDAMLKQFLSNKNWDLPDFMTDSCHDDLDILQKRSYWVWHRHRREWIDFNAKRWVQFWSKIISALHKVDKKGIINSAWTKANFDALYEYGIDYRQMAATGIDCMVVETVALGLSASRPQMKKHYDFAAALQEIKAYAPDFKLVFLHGIKDVVENWDNLRHAPPAYERELYTLANCYYRDKASLKRSADGLLACLADGIRADEWDFIRQRWQSSFAGNPIMAGQVTAVWSEAMIERGLADFDHDGFPPGHDQITKLMECGVQIQTTARIEHIDSACGPLFVPSAHLLKPEEIEKLLSLPAILGGRHEFIEKYADTGEMLCDDHYAILIPSAPAEPQILPGTGKVYEPTFGNLYFTNDRNRLEINPELWTMAAKKINAFAQNHLAAANILYAECLNAKDECTLTSCLLDANTIQVGIENKTEWGSLTKQIKVSKPIESIGILSSFPLRIKSMLDHHTFEIVIPTRGVAVASIKTS